MMESNQNPPGPDASTSLLASLARQLHAQDGEQLEISVPAGMRPMVSDLPGVELREGMVRFASLADRNQWAARAVLDELGDDALDPPALFKAAQRLWHHEIGSTEMASGRLLAAVHPRRDVLGMAAEQLSGPDPLDVFDVLHMVEALLPRLDALDWPSLIALTRAQLPRTQGDLAAGLFFQQIGQWLTAHPGSAVNLTDLLLETPSESLGFLLQTAWEAWANDDLASAVARLAARDPQANQTMRSVIGSVAAQLLRRTDLPQAVGTQLETLVQQRLASSDSTLRRSGVIAATQALHLRRTFDDRLRELSDARDPDTLAYLALAVSQHTEALLQADLLFDWLAPCTALPPSQSLAIRRIDHVLARFMKTGSPQLADAQAFLQAWITAQPPADRVGTEFSSTFSSCVGQILGDAPLLRRVLTQWFLGDDLALPEAAAGLISGIALRWRGHEEPQMRTMIGFDAELLDEVPDMDLVLLARRMLGYVIDSDLLVLLALSMLEIRDAAHRTLPLMEWLLGDEIGYDYPITTAERLKAAALAQRDGDTRALLEQIAAKLESAIAQLEALPRLRELTVSMDLRRAFHKARGRQQSRRTRDARRDSILGQIATTVHIKAGRTTFQYLQDRFTEPTGFKSVSYSIEMPRREALDPVGNAYRFHLNRTARRTPA